MNPRLPEPARAVLNALRLRETPQLDAAGWVAALAFADRARVTLPLRAALNGSAWDAVPPQARDRLDRNLADNLERRRRIEAAFAAIVARFETAGVEFLVLKGLSHGASFAPDPGLRVQYDLDFYCPSPGVARARDVLLDLGYEPLRGQDDFPVDHLPTMIRKTGWRWRGNYFDPDLPPSVDLHFRFWDAATERLAAPGVEKFWDRRVEQCLAGQRVFVLELPDQLGYAALHLLRHLLRGSLFLLHVYEIACFLRIHREDAAFWSRWRELHAPELRRLESIAFRLAQRYFGAPFPEAASSHPVVEAWLEKYAWSPVASDFRPNKHELYLHMSLLANRADRWRVLRRRLLPMRMPGPVDAVHVPVEALSVRERLLKAARHAAYVLRRSLHHARLLLPTLWGLWRWRR